MKKELRKYFKNKRTSIGNKDEKSELIANHFITSSLYQSFKNVMIFYPLKDEVDTLKIFEYLKKDKKNIIFPETIKEKNIIRPVLFENRGFIKKAYGICEPVSQTVFPKDKIDAVIIPALSVDKKKCRLGYGGGYYDRFLEDFKGIKIVVIFDELLSEDLPCDEFDICVDYVISEKGWIL